MSNSFYWTEHMINEKRKTMSCEIQDKPYYSRPQSRAIRSENPYVIQAKIYSRPTTGCERRRVW